MPEKSWLELRVVARVLSVVLASGSTPGPLNCTVEPSTVGLVTEVVLSFASVVSADFEAWVCSTSSMNRMSPTRRALRSWNNTIS